MPPLPLHIIHPAGRPDPEALARGIERLRAAGMTIAAPGPPAPLDYLAASDRDRLSSVREALRADAPRALLAARGGYGCMRLLPELADDLVDAARRHTHPLLGYSDLTALHAVVTGAGGQSVHAPLAQSFGAHQERPCEVADLRVLLTRGTTPALPLRPLRVLDTRPALVSDAHRPGQQHRLRSGDDAKTPNQPPRGGAPDRPHRPARLLGGNLSILAALCGTPWQVDGRDALLFLEDVGEPLYRLDRALATLRLAGVFDECAAIVLGQFTNCGGGAGRDAMDESAIQYAVARMIAGCGVPIYAGLPAGHGRPNRPLLLGAMHEIDVSRGLLVPKERLRAVGESCPESAGKRASGSRAAQDSGSRAAQDPAAIAARADAASNEMHGAMCTLSPPSVQGDSVLALIADALREGVGSGAQLEVLHRGRRMLRLAAGRTARTEDAVARTLTSATRFDLASLTKALVTAPLAALARERGLVGVSDRIPAHISRSEATLGELLRHCSGLPAHLPVFESTRRTPADAPSVDAAFAHFRDALSDDAWRGRSRYSDVGYVVLGRWLEELFGEPLHRAFDRHFASPLGLDSLTFGDGRSALGDDVAATEYCAWRGRTLQGVVHDENAQELGGVAGHAGLFGTAEDVARLVHSFATGEGSPLGELARADMWDPAHRCGSFGHGWDSPSGPRSSAGSLMEPRWTVGHLGFTGTSVWYDRKRELLVVLLTNRVHPSRDDQRIRTLRPALHDAIAHHLL